MATIVPAILASSKEELNKTLRALAAIHEVTDIQIDAVDGRYAKPACWPYTSPNEFRTMARGEELLPHIQTLSFEADLMTDDPETAAHAFMQAGANRIVVHAESVTNVSRLLRALKLQHGHEKEFLPGLVSIGLATGIASELSLIEPYLETIDFVQFMGIAKIGQQGNLFDRRVIDKIRAFKVRHADMPIQVDGGITVDVARELLGLGVSRLIIGSAIVKAPDIAEAYEKFESLITSYGV